MDPRPPLLGAIADDLTGATDLAGGLAREGLRVTIAIGVPDPDDVPSADAVVVALKSRSIPSDEAIDASLRALDWLIVQGTERVYFKYGSTFDSTAAGNIGPVTEALQARLGTTFTVACPAYPANGRTVYQGHLFVGSDLLSDSAMRHHPTNPMADSSVIRLLGAQTTGLVGLIPLEVVARGPDAIRAAIERLAAEGARHGVTDSITDADLQAVAAAVADDRLVTGGSALAAAIAAELRGSARGPEVADVAVPATSDRWTAVIAGSCSPATLRQVESMRADYPTFAIDPAGASDERAVAESISAWAVPHLGDGPVLIHSCAETGALESATRTLGRDAGMVIERALGAVAARLVADGVRRLVVAGGETSGAVVEALGIRFLAVGPEIEPGVPWVRVRAPEALRLVLKSGNFGSPDFFAVALARMP